MSIARHRKCVLLALSLAAGCAAPKPAGAPSVSDAARRGRESTGTLAPLRLDGAAAPRADRPPAPRAAEPEALIANVSGSAIPRALVVDLLLRSRGPEVLEQLIVAKGAEAKAAELGLSVTAEDIRREEDRALRRLTDPLAEQATGALDAAAAERALEAVLNERGISRAEYRLGVERNATLRKIAESQTTITEDQLQAEFDRVSGERVEIRHIQVPSLREAALLEEKLAAGEDFAALAGRHSANLITASGGGLLAPFSAGQEEVPALMRESAFSLAPGAVSGALKIGPWYHLIRVERRLPADTLTLEAVRDRIRQSLLQRLAEQKMQVLYVEIFQKADVRIIDQVLKEAFDKRYPRRGE